MDSAQLLLLGAMVLDIHLIIWNASLPSLRSNDRLWDDCVVQLHYDHAIDLTDSVSALLWKPIHQNSFRCRYADWITNRNSVNLLPERRLNRNPELRGWLCSHRIYLPELWNFLDSLLPRCNDWTVWDKYKMRFSHAAASLHDLKWTQHRHNWHRASIGKYLLR